MTFFTPSIIELSEKSLMSIKYPPYKRVQFSFTLDEDHRLNKFLTNHKVYKGYLPKCNIPLHHQLVKSKKYSSSFILKQPYEEKGIFVSFGEPNNLSLLSPINLFFVDLI